MKIIKDSEERNLNVEEEQIKNNKNSLIQSSDNKKIIKYRFDNFYMIQLKKKIFFQNLSSRFTC